MSGTFPTISEVVAWLRDRDQPAMAVAVEMLHRNCQAAQAVNQKNVDAYNALREKYEPRRKWEADYTPPPEASG